MTKEDKLGPFEFSKQTLSWYSALSDDEFRAYCNSRRSTSRELSQIRWANLLLEGRRYKRIHDFSMIPSTIECPHVEYIRYVGDRRQQEISSLYYPDSEIKFTSNILRGEYGDEDLVIALNLLPFLRDPLQALEFLTNLNCNVLSSLSLLIPDESISKGPNGESIVTECDGNVLPAYYNGETTVSQRRAYALSEDTGLVYYAYEVDSDRGIRHVIALKSGEMKIVIGAREFWKQSPRVKELSKVLDKLKSTLWIELNEICGGLDNKRVLDLGCGLGRIPSLYPNISYYVGVDQILGDVKDTPSLKVIRSTVEDFRTSDHFDAVVLIDVLQHLEQPKKMIQHVIEKYDSKVYIFRVIANHLSTPHFHDTKCGTTSISYPISYFIEAGRNLERNYPVETHVREFTEHVAGRGYGAFLIAERR